MTDFIIKYWIELLLTTLVSSTIYVLKQYLNLKKGMRSLLKNEIVRIYEKYTCLGYCPSYMKENLNDIYSSYHGLKGDGMATSMFNEILKLPSKKGDDTEWEII
jgi:hypothetical protein